jgi:site-specific recombinase XerD
MAGTRPDGSKMKPRTLDTRNWSTAAQLLLQEEAGVKKAAAKASIENAIVSFQQSKSKISKDRQKRIARLLNRLREFLSAQKIFDVEDVKLPHLNAYKATWTDAETTQRVHHEIIRAFFTYCHHADFVTKNPVTYLKSIPKTTPMTDPFTEEELQAIFEALPLVEDEYGRKAQAIAEQTRAFLLVMRYSGMAIGDVTNLRRSQLQGNHIRTQRVKTDKNVNIKLPDPVVNILLNAPHDSDEYFFWSGNGQLKTRSNKWGERLQRLFRLAGVRIEKKQVERRVAGKKTGELVTREVSKAKPHMLRHSLSRDLLAADMSVAGIAQLLGNSIKTVEKYYSKFDDKRQRKLDQDLLTLWDTDPLTKLLDN